MKIKLSPKQSEFVNCPARFCAFVGGVRSGKSFAGTAKGIRFARRKRTVGAVVAPTYTMLRDVLIPLWQRLLPARWVKKFSRSEHKLWLKNGSVVLFRSAEIPERLYGLTLHWFHIDEAATLPRKVWDVMLSRVISTRGFGFITTTPNGHNWVWELVNSGQVSTIFAKTADNPLIDPAEIERARRILDPKFFRQQYEASFESYLGQVYPDFGEENIARHQPRPDLPTYLAADFGWRHPTALLWAQTDGAGNIFIFDEVVESFMTPQMVAEIIMGKTVRLPSGRIFRARVPYDRIAEIITGFEATHSRQESGGMAMADILMQMGISKIRAVGGSIFAGIFAVRGKIRSADGKVHLFVDPECKRTIADFRGYHYPENSSGSATELPEKDGVHDHTMDAIRYLVTALEQKKGIWRI